MFLGVWANTLLLVHHAACASVVSIPAELTYLLPQPFKGFETSLDKFFGNGTTSHGFVDTVVKDKATSKLFSSAKNAPFVSYSPEFDELFGPNPQLKFITQRKSYFAYEAGVWDPENNEVWFTSSLKTPPKKLYILNLDTGVVRVPVTSGPPIVNPSGGFYYNRTVYLTTFGNKTYPGGIEAVDPTSKKVTRVLNTYFGAVFNGVDDLVWVTRGNAQYLYFTDPNYTANTLTNGTTNLPNTVYRFSPQDQSLVPALPRADTEVPNGIAADPARNILYVTDAPLDYETGVSQGKGTSAIYAYDIRDDGTLVNKRLFGQPRVGIADGIKVDKNGNVWTGEGEGIVVRAPSGKVLGIFNSQALLDPTLPIPISNFAFAGRTLVILAVNRIYTLRLNVVL